MSLVVNIVGVPIAARFNGPWKNVVTEDGKVRGFTYLCMDTFEMVYRFSVDSKDTFLRQNEHNMLVWIDAEVWDAIRKGMKIERVEVYDERHNVLFTLPAKKFDAYREKVLRNGSRYVYGVNMQQWLAYDGSPIYAPIGATKWRI